MSRRRELSARIRASGLNGSVWPGYPDLANCVLLPLFPLCLLQSHARLQRWAPLPCRIIFQNLYLKCCRGSFISGITVPRVTETAVYCVHSSLIRATKSSSGLVLIRVRLPVGLLTPAHSGTPKPTSHFKFQVFVMFSFVLFFFFNLSSKTWSIDLEQVGLVKSHQCT